MLVISLSHFKGMINIPIETAPNSQLLGENTQLQAVIDRYESDILTQLLGYQNFKEFETHITDSSGKWFELLKGKEYTKSGNLYKWKGLTFKTGDLDESLIAYYVYYFFLQDKQASLSGVGMVRNEAKNAVSVNSNQEMIQAWNTFVKMVQTSNNGIVGLYQFIQDMNDIDNTTYPMLDCNFNEFKYKNYLGL